MKYKVGDRVMTNENSVYYERTFNKTATIIYIDSDYERYLLEFDEDVDGHSGLGEFQGKDNHCWWVYENDFELIENTHLKFKKGDNVIIKSTEYRDSYKCTLECVGTIVDAEYKQYIDDERITYRVRIDNLDNKYQVDGLWIFHKETSLELCDDDQNDTFNYWLSARTMGRQQYLINKNYGVTHATDYPSIQQLHTMSDYIDDCIAQAVLDKPTEETKTFNIKGENEMNKILEVYYGRKRDKINAEFGKKCDKIKLADENYKVYKECVDKLAPIYEKTKQTFHDITKPYFSDETNKKLDELDLKREEELTKLDNDFDEVNAQISMCETYEQKQSVLKLYKVIDENGKLNA